MSGRHAHTRRRLALVTAATVIAMPLGVAMAGSAHADTLGGLGGLLGGGTSSLPVVGGALGNSGLPVVGDLLGGVTGGSSAADPTAALAPVTSAVDSATAGTPAAGVLDTVTGLAGGGTSAKAISSAATPDAISGLLSNPTGGLGSVTGGNLPVVGNLGGGALAPVTGLLAPVTGLVDSLGLGDLVGGLLGTVTGLVDGVTGGLLGNGIDTDEPSSHGSHDSRGGDDFEETALPHTGANTDATALMLCAGLAVAGTGVTLVSRRRRGALSI
ncbi:MAG TPA: hypothetical protein VGJ14_05415 [Sporichthyaceae bacterium]|jgi:hypothetical protein